MVDWPRDSKIGYLAEVGAGDLIRVLWLSPRLKFGSLGCSTPRIGEVFECLRKEPEGFLVARPDGSRASLPFSSQEDIAVEFLHRVGADAH